MSDNLRAYWEPSCASLSLCSCSHFAHCSADRPPQQLSVLVLSLLSPPPNLIYTDLQGIQQLHLLSYREVDGGPAFENRWSVTVKSE